MDTAAAERRTIISKLNALMLLIGQLDLSNNDSIDYVCIHVECIYADLIELDLSSDSTRICPQVLQKVFECWELFQDCEESGSIPGRPLFEISPSIIETLMNLQFTSFDIALILGVSRSTVCRRMRQNGLSYSDNYCCISDCNLDEIVMEISMDHPRCGSKMMHGHLRSRGIIHSKNY